MLVLKAVLITAVFLVLILLIYMTKDEKKSILHTINKVRGK